MRFRRRQSEAKAAADAKPYRVTIHAPHDQYHTFAMGPGDAVGVGNIRVDIATDGTIQVRPNEVVAGGAVREVGNPRRKRSS